MRTRLPKCSTAAARVTAGGALCAALIALGACSPGPRPQILVVVDTDAPVFGQLFSDANLPPAAMTDTLRIDMIDAAGNVYDQRELAVSEPSDWPVSFGITSPTGIVDDRVRIRLRAFSARRARPSSDGVALDPWPETAIDRLVDLQLPESGVDTVRLTLALGCLGTPVSLLEQASTCIDSERLHASPDDPAGISRADTQTGSAVASSSWLETAGCEGPEVAGAICIAGGFDILGDAELVGLKDLFQRDSVPVRPVFLSPFWMDEHEFTVGQMRSLVRAGRVQGELPYDSVARPSTTFAQCTWRGPDFEDSDSLPLNCVPVLTAREVCELVGGSLPTEAQWEHAARGRGQMRRFPWGDSVPGCCSVSAARRDVWCGAGGLEAVGSYRNPPGCAFGDVSRDGVLDLGGSLTEYVLDRFVGFDDPCWQWRGIRTDPSCEGLGSSGARGGAFNQGLPLTRSAIRHLGFSSEPMGFRCVYEDVAP